MAASDDVMPVIADQTTLSEMDRRRVAERRKLELQVRELEKRLNAKWYSGRFFIEVLSGAVVASALLATWIISYMQPLLSKKQEIAALEVQIQSKEIQRQKLENDEHARVLQDENKLVKAQLVALGNSNLSLKRQQDDAERNAQLLKEQLSSQEKVLRNLLSRVAFSGSDRQAIQQLATQSKAAEQAVHQSIQRLQAQQEGTRVRSNTVESALFQNTLRNTTWKIECPKAKEDDLYYVQLRGDGFFGYNWDDPDSFTFDGTDRWKVQGSTLTLTWSSGDPVETYNFSAPTSRTTTGKVSNETCTATITKLR